MTIDVTTTIRDTKYLTTLTRTLAEIAIAEIKSKGINPLVVETYRPLERQYYLYCHNRSVSEAIAGGVPKAKAEKYVAQLK